MNYISRRMLGLGIGLVGVISMAAIAGAIMGALMIAVSLMVHTLHFIPTWTIITALVVAFAYFVGNLFLEEYLALKQAEKDALEADDE